MNGPQKSTNSFGKFEEVSLGDPRTEHPKNQMSYCSGIYYRVSKYFKSKFLRTDAVSEYSHDSESEGNSQVKINLIKSVYTFLTLVSFVPTYLVKLLIFIPSFIIMVAKLISSKKERDGFSFTRGFSFNERNSCLPRAKFYFYFSCKKSPTLKKIELVQNKVSKPYQYVKTHSFFHKELE